MKKVLLGVAGLAGTWLGILWFLGVAWFLIIPGYGLVGFVMLGAGLAVCERFWGDDWVARTRERYEAFQKGRPE